MLVGDSNFKTALTSEVTADYFAEEVLGFEEVEELEEEDGGAGGYDAQTAMMMGGSYS